MASETILAIRAAPTHAAPSSERIAQNEQNEQGILEAQTSCLTTENLQVIVRAIGTGPAPITCSGVDLAQHESPPQDGKQLGAENPDKHDSPALSDRGNSPHGSCFQGVSAATAAIAITYSPAAFSADANRRSASASLTSLESNLVRGQQDTASYKGASPPNSHGKANCLEPRLETITASLRPGIDFTAVPRSALASLETIHAVQNKDKASDKGGVAVEFDIESDDDVVSQEPPRDIPRATTPSVQRPTTSRHPTAATGYRALHSTRMRRRCSHRTVQKTVKGGNQASQRPRALQAPQADIAVTRRPGIPKVDMRGVSHVVGGLVEHSLGFDNPLFAKQVEGDRSDPYNTIKVVRHEFFRFPPPDMGEHNREFERELEESRPIYEGFDSATIDQQLHGYVAHTKVFTEVMGEHLAHLNRLDTLFVSNKKKLAHLGHERQRAMANTSSRGEAMTRKEQVKVIARVAEAEELLMKEQDAVREELNEVIMRGRANITRALGQDLGAPAMIDRQRTRANQRKIIEERDTEMGIAAAMVGLRGNLKEQDDQTHEAIMRNAQLVVDERMKAFDQEDNWRRPEKPAPVTPTPNVDTIVTSVPEWFTILEAKKAISLRGATLLEKFKDLLLQMRTSVHDAREEQRDEELRPTKHKWNKQYHKPDDAWPNAVQRINGGWWHCRGGPDAPPPERNCKLCHREVPAEAPGPSATTRHQRLLEEIEMAQAEANRKDRLFLKYRLQQEYENINRYWQHREWRRSGGGVSISEVLHGRDVNDLNYRSSAEPQSWQHPGALFRSPESDQKQAVQETLAPETTPLPSPQHPCGFQVPELLSGRQISPGSRSAGGPSTPPRHMSRSPLFYEVLPGGQLNRDPGLHNKSPSRPARRLHGSPMSHEVLSSRNIDKDISTQAAPIPGLHRHNSSQVHDILHDRQVNNDTLSPTQDRPPRPRSSMSRPGQTNKPKTVSWQL